MAPDTMVFVDVPIWYLGIPKEMGGENTDHFLVGGALVRRREDFEDATREVRCMASILQ